MKVCTKCKENKPLSDFQKQKNTRDGLRYDCRTCHVKTTQEWYQRNRDKVRAGQKTEDARIKRRNRLMRKRYGITAEQYQSLLDKQQYRCAICRRHQDEFDKFLALDHNHKTGAPRELLCFGCNHGIGWFRDEPEVLEAWFLIRLTLPG